MFNLYIITVMFYAVAAQFDKYSVSVIKVQNIPFKSKNVFVMTPSESHDESDVDSYEDSDEVWGIENFRMIKYNKKDIANKLKEDIRSYFGDDRIVGGDDRIVGGVEVDINLYPYHVAYGSNCGGAIIDKNWIITAGHCGKKNFIRVGSKYINQGKKINVKRSHIHPTWAQTYKEHPFDYDYQLVELKVPLKFDESIQPVKIGHLEDMVIGTVITVTGWGHTFENGAYSSVLRAVRVPIIAKDHCQSVRFPYFRGSLTPRMFCAGFPEGKKDACQGDSGGPAVANDRLLGIISFGYGCATPGSYGVYSKVAMVRDWIIATTGIKFD